MFDGALSEISVWVSFWVRISYKHMVCLVWFSRYSKGQYGKFSTPLTYYAPVEGIDSKNVYFYVFKFSQRSLYLCLRMTPSEFHSHICTLWENYNNGWFGGEQIFMICLATSKQYRHVTNWRTDILVLISSGTDNVVGQGLEQLAFKAKDMSLGVTLNVRVWMTGWWWRYAYAYVLWSKTVFFADDSLENMV